METHHDHSHHDREMSYRLLIRTILWVIAGMVALGLMVWWALT